MYMSDVEQQAVMCQEILSGLATVAKLLTKRDPIDVQVMISTTRAYVVDYKDRRHLFIYSANTLTVTLQDLGDLTIPQNTWVNIGFQEGLNIFALSQVAMVPIFVRATDEVVP